MNTALLAAINGHVPFIVFTETSAMLGTVLATDGFNLVSKFTAPED